MKQFKNLQRFNLHYASAVVALFAMTAHAATDISTTPLNTYTATSSTDVKPNILFVLDDSGSMDSDYLPDEADVSDLTQRYNAKFNGLAYNPAITYSAPLHFSTGGVSDSTTYLSMTGVSSTTGGNGSASSSSRNWSVVKDDAYGVQSTGTSSLTPSTSAAPYFFTTVPGEYCTNSSLRVCATQTTATTSYAYPSYLRWCNGTTCQAGYDSTTSYTTARMPSPRTSTITFSSASSAVVTGITVDGLQIMQASSNGGTSTSTASTLASYVVTQINNCTYVRQGNCQVEGYTASRSGAVVTITAPSSTSSTPSVSKTGTVTVATNAFAQGTIPGENLRTTITPGVTSYPYPGTSTKASTRTDCSGTTCSYNEEMANYANWWTYYRTRMQMMKSSATTAFAAIDSASDISGGKSKFRLGYMSINNNTGTDLVNLGEFTGTQKGTWFTKLTSASPGSSTPLRQALSDAGLLYSGLLNSTTFNGVTVTDPLQYSCQKNFTLLSTDGFWNGNAGYKLDGSTAVGNQDAGMSAPYGDGGTATLQAQTSTLQTAAVSPRYSRSTSQLQTRTTSTQTAPSIQKQTSSNSGVTWSSWVNVSTCTPVTTGTNRVNCQVPISTSSDRGVTWTNWTYASSCTAKLTGRSQTMCSGSITVTSSWADVSSCTVSGGVECQYAAWSTATTVSTCTALAQSTGSPYTVGTAVQCVDTTGVAGTWSNATGTCTETATNSCRYTSWSSLSTVSACTAVPQSTGPTYTVLTARQCQTTTSGGTSDTLSDVAMYYYKTDLRDSSAVSPDATGTCTGPIISPNTTANDLCSNNVPTYGRDTATYQHMTTYTLGLGAQGKMVYAPTDGKDYWNDTSGDFYDIYKSSTTNTSSGICSWQTSGTCYWPTPSSNSNANIDDLWHAGVNGRGSYFSAKDPSSLATSLTNLLTAIAAVPRPGTAAAAASSNPNVSSSDNFIFSSSYESVAWYGELVRQEISTTGTLTGQNWSAMRLLDCATQAWQANKAYLTGNVYRYGSFCYLVLGDYTSSSAFDASSTGVDGVATRKLNEDEASTTPTPVAAKSSRTIYTNSSSALIPFTLTSLTTAGLDSYFSKTYLTGKLSQFCASGATCLSSTDQTNASGSNLVSFVRGDRTYENYYYRQRTHVLGDIVSSEGRYVKTPLFNYTDSGYSDYKTLTASRKAAVYVGANDGMLHAFEAATGQELWGYVPQAVIPNLYALADINYSSNHQYFVDNTPEVGDISVACTPVYPATTCNPWKTIIVGGFNRGGTSYYALDVTDPDNPTYLWTFANSSMGYSYGDPRITKLKDGTWVVILSSGYNNSDGRGYVYVVNAYTGALIRTFTTGTGTTGAPTSIARISAHAPNADTDNTTYAVYGGDLQGNLWRFDVNGDMGASGYDTQLLITYKDSSNVGQPITAKPVVATIEGKTVIFVGTGRYLGTTDITDSQSQSFYAVKDTGGAATLTSPRLTGSGFKQQTFTTSTCSSAQATTGECTLGATIRVAAATVQTVSWSTDNGWYIDLVSGEKAYTDPALALGTLLFTTNIPSLTSATVCGDASTAGAKSFLYELDYATGTAITTSGVIGVALGDGYATRPVVVKLADGSVRTLVRVSTGTTSSSSTDMGSTTSIQTIVKSGSAAGLRRVSWRELTTN